MSGFALKLIAIFTMTLDHLGYAFTGLWPEAITLSLRVFGRLAMPLFCLLIAEGFFYTKNVQKYAGRLLLFAFISEVPFDLLLTQGRVPLEFSNQNVYFTLFLGLLAIFLCDRFALRGQKGLALISVLAAAGLSELLRADYGIFGVLFIFIFYRFRGDRTSLSCWYVLAVLLLGLNTASSGALQWALIGLFELLSLPLILTYNRRRGYHSRFLQHFFYVFYPLHMLLIAGLYLALRP